MAEPTNKKEILEQAETNFNNLLKFVDELPDEFRTKNYINNELNERDKTISDVICHLHEWHLMVMNWYKIGLSGKIPAIPAEDVTWENLNILNQRIYEKYKGTELEKAITMFKKSYKDIITIIEQLNDNELFTKNKYEWTGNELLGSLFIFNTSSHYDWAIKTIKPIKKFIK